jgi:hypothetical protein
VYDNFAKRGIKCISERQIHEATMCFLKSHWENAGGFNEHGCGEGAGMIDGFEDKVNPDLDIGKLMVCVCHKKNTCNKAMFLNNSFNAEYTFQDGVIPLIKEAIDHPLYKDRVRFCFKYPSRSRPDLFKSTLNKYVSLLSNKYDYNFIFSFDEDDVTMNNDQIKSFLSDFRKNYQMEYTFNKSESKVHAINRDMNVPTFDILLLISDDMIPQVQDYDDIIVQDFKKYFPDYDGMLNYNDGLRADWPKLCTLTVYGDLYFKRFGYIYNPEYTSVYCDQEQTDVGRILKKIQDIDRCIVKHCWSEPAFQDTLRLTTESPDMYAKDLAVYQRRKSTLFDIVKPAKNNIWLSILIPSLPSRLDKLTRLVKKFETLINNDSRYELLVIIDNKQRTIGSKRNELLSLAKGRYFVFIDDDDDVHPDYIYVLTSIFQDMKNDEIDLITYNQDSCLNGVDHFIIDSSIQNKSNDLISNEGPWQPVYKRLPWIWSVFKKELAKGCKFPDKNYNEDVEFLAQILPKVKMQLKTDSVLHFYNFDKNLTETQKGISS